MTLRSIRIKTYLSAIIFFVILGSTLVVTSFLPFEFVKSKIDSLAPDGEATSFSLSYFNWLIPKFRLVGIGIIIVSVFLFICIIYRRQTQKYASDILLSFSSFMSELKRCFYRAINKEDKIHLFTIFIIIIIAIVVRICFLFQPMRYDEAFTFTYFASKPLYIGLSSYIEPNNHIFHTFLVHIAYLFLGNKPWVIRLPALISGILLVPASYLLIRKFYNKHAALLTTAIIASSSYLIEWSTNARGYSLLCLIFLLIITLAIYLKQSTNQAAWLTFALLCTLGFYTIPIMLLPFGIVILWLFLSLILKDINITRSLMFKNLLVYSIIIVLLTLILYLPVILTSGVESIVAHKHIIANKRVDLGYFSFFWQYFPRRFGQVWTEWNRDIPMMLKILLALGFFLSLVFHKRLTVHRVHIILPAAIWLIPVISVQRVGPAVRGWQFLLPLYIGLSCSGITFLLKFIDSIIGKYKSVIIVFSALTLSLWLGLNVIRSQSVCFSDEASTLRDAEQVTLDLKDYLKPGDKVVAHSPSDQPLIYYFNMYSVPAKYIFSESDRYIQSESDDTSRIIVIVNDYYNQNLMEVLDKRGVLAANLGDPKLIYKYEYASVYKMNRIQIRDH